MRGAAAVGARPALRRVRGRAPRRRAQLAVEALRALGDGQVEAQDGTHAHYVTDVAAQIVRAHRRDMQRRYQHHDRLERSSVGGVLNTMHRNGDLPMTVRLLRFDHARASRRIVMRLAIAAPPPPTA